MVLKNVDFAHYGLIDGENKWRDYKNLIIVSIPYLPSYYSSTAMMALNQSSIVVEDKEDIESSNIAVKIIQLMCRIIIRMLSDKKGNCPSAEIYLLLDGDEPYPGDVNFRPLLKQISPYLLDQIQKSLHNITIGNWDSFNGFQTRTSNSVPKGGVTDAFIAWLNSLKPDEPINKKVFESLSNLSKTEKATLSVQLSKKNSSVKRELESKNILIHKKPGSGTIFT